MSRREFPNSKLKDLKPSKAWAAVSYDTPPEIWHVEWYREHLPGYLRHVRVTVTPILPKPRKPAAKKRTSSQRQGRAPMSTIQQHPHYHEGFFDALDFTPIHDDCTPEYRAGWEAAWRAKEIFRNAGFEDKGREFTATTTLRQGELK